MRALSLVKRIEFEFPGNVARNALALGDVDNDGCNELVVGNHNGEVAIFKGREKFQTITKLSFVSCIAIGDVMNQNKNILIVVTGDGWCYLYAAPEYSDSELTMTNVEGIEQIDGQIHSTSGTGSFETLPSSDTGSTIKIKRENDKNELVCIHKQRIPANAKHIILGDIDGDGYTEMVLGLTDRVVRSYRWIANPHKSDFNIMDANLDFEPSEKLLGKFLALNKWECANQIGSITLHHSLDGKASILIAQPGGTFMRIKCSSDSVAVQEDFENSGHSHSNSSGAEVISGTVDYQFLGISRMRNPNISTEILGDLRREQTSEVVPSKGKPYALATLDGTIMLVQDEVISWAFAVDHQIFALTKLDVTGNGSDDIVVCSWDGQTYILDQDKNCVRFHLDEPVQAFESGFYNLKTTEADVTCLVYINFKNTIAVYYDLPLKELTCKKFEPDPEKLSKLFVGDDVSAEKALEIVKTMDRKTKKELVEHLLYNV
ncbi:unnamed protein product [Phaedon cochleariae]|uniref:KICSTOR complex protein ITFG2-like n=1 Tax=Phaedon cochleariae TaxID=80249 RepID=A0A9N9X584_PHACE|nr:unnamed protein product [Phaedon cochleariae]